MSDKPTILSLVIAKDEITGGFKAKDLRLRDAAQAAVNDAVERSSKLMVIESDEDLTHFIDVAAELKDLIGQIDGARVDVKKPFLEAGKLIDKRAKEFSIKLEHQSNRIKMEIGRFEGDRRRALWDEQQRLERLAREAMQARATAPTEEKKTALDEIARESISAAKEIKPVTPGIQVKLGWKSELVDWQVVARTNPGLLRVELNKVAVNDMIRSLEEGHSTITENTIPGVKLTAENGVVIR
jgi:hypothetical protein